MLPPPRLHTRCCTQDRQSFPVRALIWWPCLIPVVPPDMHIIQFRCRTARPARHIYNINLRSHIRALWIAVNRSRDMGLSMLKLLQFNSWRGQRLVLSYSTVCIRSRSPEWFMYNHNGQVTLRSRSTEHQPQFNNSPGEDRLMLTRKRPLRSQLRMLLPTDTLHRPWDILSSQRTIIRDEQR